MKVLFQTYLQNSISLSVIGILFLALSPIFSRRYSAKCRYSLWLIVLFALILPVRPQISIPVPGMMQPLISKTGNLMMIENGSSVSSFDFWQIAALVWAGGALCYLLWYSVLHLRFMSAISRWSGEISPDQRNRFFELKTEMGIKRNIAIRSCAYIQTPMMAGFRKPVILFPEIDLSPDEFDLVVRHELVHYKRKDLYTKLLMMLVLVLHWYNPVVHIMTRSVLALCEISCDEEVLQGTDRRSRARYGETIIGVIRQGKFYQTALSTNFYSGAKDIKKRIYAMMDMKRKRFSPIALCIVCLITFCGISAVALTTQSELTFSESSALATKAAGSTSSASSASSAKSNENQSDSTADQNKIIADNDSSPHLVTEVQPAAVFQAASERSNSITHFTRLQ